MNQSPLSGMNQKNLDALLQTVSQKLGIPQEQLRSDLETGKLDNAMRNMSSSDAAKFSQVIQNPQMVEKLMSTPQAKAIYQKLTGRK